MRDWASSGAAFAVAKVVVYSMIGLVTDDGRPVPYGVLTLHRPSNVDDERTFERMMRAIDVVAHRLPVVFPVHPRTAARVRAYLDRLSPTRGV